MEKNRQILKKALGQMRLYDPTDKCWISIEKTLEEEHQFPVLDKLNTYSPPDSIWENIDGQLSATKPGYRKNRIILSLKWASLAAAIFVMGLILYKMAGNREYRLSYSEEWVSVASFQDITIEDSLSSIALDRKCRKQPEICKSDGFIELKNELDFLNESKKTIVNRLNKYDPDNELKALLTRIDLQRAEIIGKLIEYSN